MASEPLDLEPIRQRAAAAHKWLKRDQRAVTGSEWMPLSVREHFEHDVAALLAAVARLTELTAVCNCYDGNPANYEGPSADCPVHGAVLAFNEAQREIERYKATSERFTDPTITKAIAREIESVRPSADCEHCRYNRAPCARHLAEHLVDAMRDERLVVLTIQAADEIAAGIKAEAMRDAA